MAYERCGTYTGPLDAALDAVDSFTYYWAPQGYWCVDGRKSPIEEQLRPLVDDCFPGDWAFTMLVKLEQGNTIPPHCDKPLAAGIVRRHLVIATDPSSWCMHGGEWQQLDAGGIYLMDPQYIHAAINWGVTPRIHLVVDSREGND